VIPPALFFLLSITFAIWVFYDMNFGIDFSISVQNDIGILMQIALNLRIAFGNVTIFTKLILPKHEPR
jgi:hypothetical protein